MTKLNCTDIEGSWELREYRIIADKIEKIVPNVLGILQYCSSGHMSVVIAKTPDELRTLADVISYAGTYSIIGNIIEHDVAVSSIPRFVNTKLKRSAELTGNTLILATTDRESDIHTLTWTRLKSLR